MYLAQINSTYLLTVSPLENLPLTTKPFMLIFLIIIEKLLTLYDAKSGPKFGVNQTGNLAVLPSTQPLSYTLKPKSLARRVFEF